MYVSQGSVATQLVFRGIFDNYIIANVSQNVSLIKFLKSVNICLKRHEQKRKAYFFGPPCGLVIVSLFVLFVSQKLTRMHLIVVKKLLEDPCPRCRALASRSFSNVCRNLRGQHPLTAEI